MRNELVLFLYLIAALSVVAVMFLTIIKLKNNKLYKSMLMIGINLFIWLVMEILIIISPDVLFIQVVFDLKLPFVALSTFSLLYYVVYFFGMEKTFPKEVVLALLIIPIFTLVLAATTTLHPFIRTEFIVYELTPVHVYENIRGPWFWYHSFYCYSVLIAAFLLSVFNFAKTPKGQRFPAALLLLTLSIIFGSNVLYVFLGVSIDLSLLSAAITLILLFYATKNYDGLYFLIEARASAFNHTEESVFILDEKMEIINSNRAAKNLLEYLDMPRNEKKFPRILGRLASRSEKEVPLNEIDTGIDYYLKEGKVFNVRQRILTNTEGLRIVYFVVVSDETNNRNLIKELDEYSGLDALTGLNNRRKNEEDIKRLDREENYPLAILYGDLNNLKQTNDKFGHQHGDVLLRLASEALKSVCSPNASISRVGGDEFVIILPQHDDEKVRELIKDIRSFFKRESEKYLFDASIALGYAIKYDKNTPIEEVIKTADANMYNDKKYYKWEPPPLLAEASV